MHIEQVFDEQVKFLGTDAALVIMEVVAEKQPHLPDAACLGVAMPLPHPRIERTIGAIAARTSSPGRSCIFSSGRIMVTSG